MIEEILGVRKLVRLLGYRVDKLSQIFCDNKGAVTATHRINIMIKKYSTILAFHQTREAVTLEAMEI